MTYAVQSTGRLTKGSISSGDHNLEWLSTIWGQLESELRKCCEIAVNAVNANHEAGLTDSDCPYDATGDDYDALQELHPTLVKSKRSLTNYAKVSMDKT